MGLYYEPSNKMPLGGIVLFLLGGAAAAAVLALVYVYAMWYIPFIYVNFALCLGFGFGLALALSRLVRLGKLRSPRAVAWLALLVGLAAVYLEWAVYLTLLFNEGPSSAPSSVAGQLLSTALLHHSGAAFSPGLFAAIAGHPGGMWSALREINQTGLWKLYSSTPSGLLLWAVWLAEAAIIAGIPYLLAAARAHEPFSESTNAWAGEETLAHPVGYLHHAADARRALETGQFDVLTPHVAEAELDRFARVKLHRAPADDACQFLTLENVTKERDNKGKITQRTAAVVQRLAISPAAYQALKTQFGAPPRAGV